MEWDQPGSLLLRLDLFVGGGFGHAPGGDFRVRVNKWLSQVQTPQINSDQVQIWGVCINVSENQLSIWVKFDLTLSINLNWGSQSNFDWGSQLTSIGGLSQISIEGLN